MAAIYQHAVGMSSSPSQIQIVKSEPRENTLTTDLSSVVSNLVGANSLSLIPSSMKEDHHLLNSIIDGNQLCDSTVAPGRSPITSMPNMVSGGNSLPAELMSTVVSPSLGQNRGQCESATTINMVQAVPMLQTPTNEELMESITDGHVTTPIQQIACPVCGKLFPQKALLLKHKIVHDDPKHVCDACGRGFVREDKLKRHVMSIHTLERPHVCHICTKAFSRKDKLKEHLKHHTRAARNFECQQCQQPFVQKSDLNRHIRGVHQGEPGVGINITTRRKLPGSGPSKPSKKKKSSAAAAGAGVGNATAAAVSVSVDGSCQQQQAILNFLPTSAAPPVTITVAQTAPATKPKRGKRNATSVGASGVVTAQVQQSVPTTTLQLAPASLVGNCAGCPVQVDPTHMVTDMKSAAAAVAAATPMMVLTRLHNNMVQVQGAGQPGVQVPTAAMFPTSAAHLQPACQPLPVTNAVTCTPTFVQPQSHHQFTLTAATGTPGANHVQGGHNPAAAAAAAASFVGGFLFPAAAPLFCSDGVTGLILASESPRVDYVTGRMLQPATDASGAATGGAPSSLAGLQMVANVISGNPGTPMGVRQHMTPVTLHQAVMQQHQPLLQHVPIQQQQQTATIAVTSHTQAQHQQSLAVISQQAGLQQQQAQQQQQHHIVPAHHPAVAAAAAAAYNPFAFAAATQFHAAAAASQQHQHQQQQQQLHQQQQQGFADARPVQAAAWHQLSTASTTSGTNTATMGSIVSSNSMGTFYQPTAAHGGLVFAAAAAASGYHPHAVPVSVPLLGAHVQQHQLQQQTVYQQQQAK